MKMSEAYVVSVIWGLCNGRTHGGWKNADDKTRMTKGG